MSETALVVPEQKFSLVPQNLDEALKFADILAKSDLVPKDYKGKPGNVLVAVQYGADLGVSPIQALQNIAIINGRPCVWGDLQLAIVRAHPECEDVIETLDKTKEIATCTTKRKGKTPVTRTFSKEDALKAGLWGKEGPWKKYPERMLQMRARSFSLRDSFPDALKGLSQAEEVRDIPKEIEVHQGEPQQPAETIIEGELEPSSSLQEVLKKIAECEAIPHLENVEAKYITAPNEHGMPWGEQEYSVLKQAVEEKKVTIIKALKDAESNGTDNLLGIKSERFENAKKAILETKTPKRADELLALADGIFNKHAIQALRFVVAEAKKNLAEGK